MGLNPKQAQRYYINTCYSRASSWDASRHLPKPQMPHSSSTLFYIIRAAGVIHYVLITSQPHLPLGVNPSPTGTSLFPCTNTNFTLKRIKSQILRAGTYEYQQAPHGTPPVQAQHRGPKARVPQHPWGTQPSPGKHPAPRPDAV